jgi:hypothetical protein
MIRRTEILKKADSTKGRYTILKRTFLNKSLEHSDSSTVKNKNFEQSGFDQNHFSHSPQSLPIEVDFVECASEKDVSFGE